MSNETPLVQKVLNEVNQSPGIRQSIIKEIEKLISPRKLVTFFTSFNLPVMIEDDDAVMIEGVLQKCPLDGGLTLMINSPGGSALAAERIINICRKYSKGDFEVMVPKMAKSAATMICLGANKIYMSDTAELGPVDPQTVIMENNSPVRVSVHSILESYDEILKESVNTKGNIHPYLQQLGHFDPRVIKELRKATILAEDIVVTALGEGMMKGKSYARIKKSIRPFIDPKVTKSHGRPINIDTVKKIGLNVENLRDNIKLWDLAFDLYIRIDMFLGIKEIAKLLETSSVSYIQGSRRVD